jgi:hypothetical protein
LNLKIIIKKEINMNKNKLAIITGGILFVMALSIIINGCFTHSKKESGSSAGDTTAPVIDSTGPADSATGIAINTIITATFSEAMQSSTITGTTFTLINDAGAVAGTITYATKTVTFTPSAALIGETAYTATITTGVKDLAGNPLTANYSWTFTTRDRIWGVAGLIETNDDGLAFGSQIAINADGNAIAVWSHLITANSIVANRYVSGAGWVGTQLLETDDAGAASQVQIAINADGNAIAVWRQMTNTKNSILANRYISGTGWAGAELLETDDAGGAATPQIAMGADGNAIAIWRQVTNTKYSILANRYVSSTGWAGAELLETDDTGIAESPQIAIDGNGNAIAVWRQITNTVDSIFANRYISGTGWGNAELLETDDTYAVYDPQIGVGADGNAIAVWYQNDGIGTSIWANRYVSSTGWAGPELLETDDTDAAEYPQIAIGADGNAIAIWRQITNTQYSIFVNHYISSTGWAGPELLETDDTGAAEYPQLTIGADGNAIAVWAQITSTAYSIFASRYVSGTGWSQPQALETDDTNAAYDAQIAIDKNGNAIAIWQQYDGSRYNIWSNRFE